MTASEGRMTFTDELWHSIERIYAAILRHPFIAGLTDGSLRHHTNEPSAHNTRATMASTPRFRAFAV